MGRRKGKKGAGGGPTDVTAAARISLQLQIEDFRRSDNAELRLPSSLSLEERAFVHKFALSFGLCTKSRGSGAKRYVTVYKRSRSTIVQKDAIISLDATTKKCITDLLETCPITSREKDELNSCERERTNHIPMGHLTSGAPQIPNSKYSSDILSYKKTLPVFSYAEHIMNSIDGNQVIVIVGDTGSGKTTQIPQILLDRCQRDKKPCRVICTQPRRISAISVAERVAYERGEKVGYSVGYQIRLESRISPKTVLTYCTTGVLLRTLMTGGASLATITHILIDEVHERDKFIDIILIAVRDLLTKFKELKVVLMSATVDATLFSKYFNNCPIVTIPGRTFEIQRIYLDEVLRLTKYKTDAMKKIEKTVAKNPKNKKNNKVTNSGNSAESPEIVTKVEDLDPQVQSEMNEFLDDYFNDGSYDTFGQILYMYSTEGVPVNCQHGETGMTSLMIAAYHGVMDIIETLIKMGANPSITDKEGKRAVDHANLRNHMECVEFLQNLQTEIITESNVSDNKNLENDCLLEIYERSLKFDLSIDYNLILAVIKYIHLNLPKGAILVFIAGYDDIIYLRDLIQVCSEMRQATYQLYTLHGNMQPTNQKKVFAKSTNARKIIISTNVAETSITIDDVVYVVDSGKVKENFYESMTGVSTLQKEWVSKAQSLQRSGRAGRTQPGKAFMMYSKTRYENFSDNAIPEMLRTSLHELCMQTKLLTAGNVPIADYLAKAIEPPSFSAIKSSISLLKTIGALTPMEDITEIGQHLLNLSIDPKLGKMLLYGCLLKCLDPILTIACTLAYKEPFHLAKETGDSAKKNRKKDFAANSLSDHMGLLRVFQAWQISRSNKTEKKFCDDNLVNRATMKMIMGLRTQLIAQLRAIGLVKVRGPGDIKDVNQNSEKWYVVKAALLSGLYPAVARIDRDDFTLRTSKEVKLSFHPSSSLLVSRNRSGLISSLKNIPSDWIIYEEIVRLGRSCYIRCNTAVTDLTVALFGGPLRLNATAIKANLPGLSDDSDSEQDEDCDSPHMETSSLSIDEWIVFTATPEDALFVYLLRQKFSALMIRRMLHPAKVTSQMDEKIIATVVQVLALEEKTTGLSQPTGIGQKPKPLTPELHMPRSRNNDFDSMYSYDNRQYHKSNYNNSQNMHNNHYVPKTERQQNKSHPGYNIGNQVALFQNFMAKSPSSPSGSNVLLANIEKYANSNSRASGSVLPITRYFIIKVKDPSVIELSQRLGVWNYSASTEKKLIKACQAGHKVIMFFSISDEESKFFGCAEFLNSPCKNEPSPMYHLKWISSQQIPYHVTRNLTNSLNDNKRVFLSKDGQEICAESGRGLMLLMEQQPVKMAKFRNNGRPNQKHN